MTIKIIVDSTCDLPDEIKEKNNIHVIPLGVQINENTYLDGITIKTNEIYEEMKKGLYPKTSAVNPEIFKRSFEQYLLEGMDVLYIGFSSKLSGTFQNALMASDELKNKYPEGKIVCIDSRTGALGTGLLVLKAISFIEKENTLDKIKEKMAFIIEHIHGIFTVDDIEWLYRGGRISKGKAIVGKMLNIKPIIIVKDGEMIPIHTVRGMKRAFKYIVEHVQSIIGNFTDQVIGISHAADLEKAGIMKKMMETYTGCEKYITQLIGSVLGVHLGIGGVGVFFFDEEAKKVYSNI